MISDYCVKIFVQTNLNSPRFVEIIACSRGPDLKLILSRLQITSGRKPGFGLLSSSWGRTQDHSLGGRCQQCADRRHDCRPTNRKQFINKLKSNFEQLETT